ncbi:MAG: GDP-mannose 4,6-dehydratase [Chloroflexota bacterium]
MTERPAAVITGIAGQDGSYLAELLVERGYRVVGIPRPGSTERDRIAHLLDRIEIVEADLLDDDSLEHLLSDVRPRELYNLAGHSFVPSSWQQPGFIGEVTGLGAVRLVEAIRRVDTSIRFYQASSSEIFGNAREGPQTERTPLNPRNPYGAAKAFAHFTAINARDHLGLFSVSGILFNHESPRRGMEFVSRKITDGAARISLGLAETLTMGSLDAERDWGFAGDYVVAMWLMLQHTEPADFVVASGIPHSVRDICRIAFARVGLDYERHITVDPSLVRPPERIRLLGDPSRAKSELGWTPSVSFEQLIEMMVDADVARHRVNA